MKKHRLILVFLLCISAIIYAEMRNIPDWNIDATSYEFNASVIARVYINNQQEVDTSSILGAFWQDECRGIADPVPFEDGLLFFITVYSNQNQQDINFHCYQAENDRIVIMEESISFNANQVYGSVLQPLELHGFIDYDNPPQVDDIPDQTISFSETFLDINLNNYLVELDGEDVSWSAEGYENLQVTILDGIAVIERSDIQWTGIEVITFIATDQTENALSGSDEVLFCVLPEDHPPQILDIPDQQIALSQEFEVIELNQYLIEIDNDPVTWSYSYADNSNPQPYPSWDVDPTNFEASMSMTIQVCAEGGFSEGNEHILGAFCEEECRGTAIAQMGIEGWLYFLTVYADSPEDTINFKFYDNDKQKEMNICEEVPFYIDGIIGNPLEPFIAHAGNLLIDINELNELEIIPASSSWFGSEEIIFTVTDSETQDQLSASTNAVFTILNDHVPQILQIPDQIITVGESFEQVILEDYLVELDGDQVEWTGISSENLNVSISNEIATISPVSSEWLGSDVITFIVTDQSELSASSEMLVSFTVIGIDHPPIVNNIPDQTIATGMTFEPILLNEYLLEYDGDQVCWSCCFPPEEEPLDIPDLSVDPSDFELSINLICEIESESEAVLGNDHCLFAMHDNECRGVSTAVYSMEKWLYYITIYSNNENDEISFDFYDSNKGRILPVMQNISFGNVQNTGSPMQPILLQAGRLLVEIDQNSLAEITIIDSEWAGTCYIQFIAEDLDTIEQFSDFDEVSFTIIEDHAPQILPFADQTIELGQSFEPVDLDDYLIELDGDTVFWSWSGNENLGVSIDADNILNIMALSDTWTGSETIIYRVQDNTVFAAWTTKSVTYTITPVDHPPQVSNIPDQSIFESVSFSPIDLSDYLIELDGDDVEWNHEFLGNNQPEPVPQWQVDPTDFQYTMNLTAEVCSKGAIAEGDQHILAAFSQNECRGIAYAINTLDSWLYFLTLYSNIEYEEINLKFYDSNYLQQLPCDITVDFMNNAVLGNPLEPIQINAGYLKVEINDQIAETNLIDQNWIGAETVRFIAKDINTIQQLSGFDLVLFSVASQPQFNLPESFTYNENEILQVDFAQFLNTNPQNYQLTVSENLMISVNIDGFMVTFSSPADWSGSETMMFTITDLQSRIVLTDTVEVIVTPAGDVTVTKEFDSGWNWISINIAQEDMTVNNVFSSIGSSGSRVKSQTHSAMYYPGVGWLGSLLEINNESLYKLSCNQDVVWEFSGIPVDIQETIYNLDAGWNWISYSPQISEEINYAFSELNHGIGVKNQTHSALFYGGSIWLGSLQDLQPLEGYMLSMAEAEDFNYPQPESRVFSKKNLPDFNVKEADWIVNYKNYEFNTSMIIELVSDDKDFDPCEYYLGVFSDNECRGIASYSNNAVLDYTDLLGKVYHMPMVYSNSSEGETLKISAFHIPTGKIISTNYTFTFNEDILAGSWENPIKIDLCVNNDVQEPLKLSCYPNPFNPSTTLKFELNEASNVTIDIYNIKGQLVNSINKGVLESGVQSVNWNGEDKSGNSCASGIYLFRIKTEKQIQNCRALLLK